MEIIAQPFDRSGSGEVYQPLSLRLNKNPPKPDGAEPSFWRIWPLLKTPHGDRPLILFVDDNADVARLFSVLFRKTNCETKFVDSAEAALDVLQSHPVDVIVTDFSLANMNGPELLRRRMAIRPCIGIIVTGHPRETVADQCKQCGCTEIFTKPVDFALLKQCIEQALFRATA